MRDDNAIKESLHTFDGGAVHQANLLLWLDDFHFLSILDGEHCLAATFRCDKEKVRGNTVALITVNKETELLLNSFLSDDVVEHISSLAEFFLRSISFDRNLNFFFVL